MRRHTSTVYRMHINTESVCSFDESSYGVIASLVFSMPMDSFGLYDDLMDLCDVVT